MDIERKDQEISGLIETLSTVKPKQEKHFDRLKERKQKLLEKIQKLQRNVELADSIEEIEVFERNFAPIEPTLAAVMNHNKTLVPCSKGIVMSKIDCIRFLICIIILVSTATSVKISSNKKIEPQRRLYRTKKVRQKKLNLKKPSTEETDLLAVQLLLNKDLK